MQTNDVEIEDLCAFFHGWPVEAIQLGPRFGRTLVSCNAFRTHRILRLEAGSPLAIHGVVHKACSCVLLTASPEPAARLHGKPMRVTDVVLAGAGACLNLFVPNTAIVFILVAPSGEFIAPRTVRVCDGGPQGLIQHIKQARSDSDAALAVCIQDAVGASRALPPANVRVSAVISACRHIEQNLHAAFRLDDLSRDAGVGARTLQYGFREVYRTTPLGFARGLRLTRSRLALLGAKTYTPINEVATAFGFKHMGQYAQDYRRWFGETPSMTLARVW